VDVPCAAVAVSFGVVARREAFIAEFGSRVFSLSVLGLSSKETPPHCLQNIFSPSCRSVQMHFW